MIEVVARQDRGSPVEDPSLLRAEAVIDLLAEFANIDAVDETRDGDEAGGDVVVLREVSEVQAVAMKLQPFGRPGVMTAVALISRAERIGIGLAVFR